MSEECWIKLMIDSPYFVAGERVSGEVLVSQVGKSGKLTINAIGVEKIQIESLTRNQISRSNTIFTVEEQLALINSDTLGVYPFSFKLPAFAPASFHFFDTDSDHNSIFSEISYKIETRLFNEEKEFLMESVNFIVWARNSRLIINQKLEFASELTSCWCFSRGFSNIHIETADFQYFICKESKKYRLLIECIENQHLVSIIGQIVFEISFVVPGEKTVFIRKIISRCVPSVEDLKKSASDLRKLHYIVDADLSQINFGNNPCSNHAGFFNSEYKLQLFAVYDIGFRSKRAECEVSIQINPILTKKENPVIPENWNPKEYPLKSFVPNTSYSTAYEKDDKSFISK